jgi:peptidase YpeB-like protein
MSRRNAFRTSLFAALALTSTLSIGMSPPAAAKPKAGITLAQARAIALARVPGKIVDEEIEREHGRRVYSIEIAPTGAPRGAIKEVVLDARDGRVLAVEDEGPGKGEDDEEDEDDDDD